MLKDDQANTGWELCDHDVQQSGIQTAVVVSAGPPLHFEWVVRLGWPPGAAAQRFVGTRCINVITTGLGRFLQPMCREDLAVWHKSYDPLFAPSGI